MSLNTITLDLAQQWAQNWNNNKVVFLQTSDLRAFTIPQQVLKDVMAPKEVVDIRTYLGLDDKMKPHMMVVGVDANGNDLIDPLNGFFIFNFIRPCPSACNGVAPFINNG
jgi:hypothetical protein